MNKIIAGFFVLLFTSISFLSYSQYNYRIGISQCTMGDEWRRSMIRDMQNEASLYPGLELIIKDANSNNNRQVEDIKTLLKEGIDLLIVSPNESKPLTPIVTQVFDEGIPVIVIDRNILSEKYTSHIGANNYQIGREVGNYAVKLLQGNGNILEVWGLKGSSPAIERHNGFIDVLKNYPGITIRKEISGEWEKDIAKKALNNQFSNFADIDLVFAHNDVMALGAAEVFHSKSFKKRPFILGVDALYGSQGGIEMVLSGKIDATFLYPTGGHQAIETAIEILNHQNVPREIELGTVPIDSVNARVVQVQIDQILTLQEKITAAKEVLNVQTVLVKKQKQRFFTATSVLIVIVILSLLLYKALRNKQRVNQELRLKNEKIENQKNKIAHQNEELVRVSKELEEATQSKLRFFTNISHEFRTPITLIQGPLEDMIKSGDFSLHNKTQFSMMLRNSNRLLRLVNQLMDFRKLENERLNLHVSAINLHEFLQEIKSTFDSLAIKKEIAFSLDFQSENTNVWMDADKLDKVIFNLLSNAFKFTKSGFILIRTEHKPYTFKDGIADAIYIQVTDSGQGISKVHQQRIFDRFYQVEDENPNLTGTGLGLAFSKGLMELHHGDLTVDSEEGKGTTFTIILRSGNSHFTKEEITSGKDSRIHESFKISELELEDEELSTLQTPSVKGTDKNLKEFSILVVEDNVDVRHYIINSLPQYFIYEAGNGKEALKILDVKDVDLIITDVMMPEMDGLELTRRLKTDIKTCHIPLIILTAKSTIEEKIQGLEVGADSYIPKPFNSQHLEVRVKKLIEKRKMLQQHYREHVDISTNSGELSGLDKKFLSKLTRIVEENLQDTNVSVELLSDEMGMSRVHLYRKIKSLTGLSASEFQRTIRIKKAAHLLLEKGTSVSEVAYKCGFANLSYFTKTFKDFYNVSPSNYIKQNSKGQ